MRSPEADFLLEEAAHKLKFLETFVIEALVERLFYGMKIVV